jgi:hypothetical protein
MKRIATIFAGLGVAAVMGLAAVTGTGADAPEVGGDLPLAPQGVTEPDLSDQVLFIEGEPVTGFDGDTVGDLPVVGGVLPLAPEGVPEPDLSDQVLFIEGEPVTGFDGDTVWVLNN